MASVPLLHFLVRSLNDLEVRMRLMMWFLVFACLGFGDGPSRNEFFQASYRAAVQAYQQKNYPEMIRHLIAADSVRPNTHGVVYNLAAAYALNGQNDEALHHLRLALWLNADTGYVTDDDFQSLDRKSVV